MKTLISLLILGALTNSVYAQNVSNCLQEECDTVVKNTIVYFSIGEGEWIEKSQYEAIGDFLKWAKKDTITSILIVGWADSTGSLQQNEVLSHLRARSIRNYLVNKGISNARIAFRGGGVDVNAGSNEKARRADIKGVIQMTELLGTLTSSNATVESFSQPKEQVQVVGESRAEKTTETKPQQQAQNERSCIPGNEIEKIPDTTSRWYIGVGGGFSFGRGTFASFAMDGTRPGFNVGALGGYKINKLLSAELSLDYTRMDLRTYDCCQLLWLAADGNRYAAPVAGIKNYAYNDLRSVSNLFGLGAHLNINLVSLWNEHSRWSALVSPAIYGVYSSAKLKQLSTGANVTDATSFHFGVGADLGVGYQFTDCFGLRLTTGFNYLTGKGIDGLPQEEHKANYVWNTSLKLIFKL